MRKQMANIEGYARIAGLLLGIVLFSLPSFPVYAETLRDEAEFRESMEDDFLKNFDMEDYQGGDSKAPELQTEPFQNGVPGLDELLQEIDTEESSKEGNSGDVLMEDSEIPVFDLSSARITMEDGTYCYQLEEDTRFFMSIPNGGFSTRPVAINFPDARLGIYSIERNGEPEYELMSRRFDKEGEYELLLYFITDSAGERMGGYKLPIHFRIGKSLENSLEEIHAPEGFRFESVWLDGNREKTEEDFLKLTRDGEYRIRFSSLKNRTVTYEVSFTLDTEAPVLVFSQDITAEGKLKPPLAITREEPDCEVMIYRDSREFSRFRETLSEGGYYEITVKDKAGNSRSYSFTLAKDQGKRTKLIIIIAAVILSGVVVYMAFLRRNMGVL